MFRKNSLGNPLVDGFIHALRRRMCNRPRDKVYAFYGLLGIIGFKLHSPELESTLGKVYHRFFYDLIVSDPSLIRLIMDVGSGKRDDINDAPTWVPAFNDFSSSWLDPDYFTRLHPCSAVLPFEGALSWYLALRELLPQQESRILAYSLSPPDFRRELKVMGVFQGTAPFCTASCERSSTLERQISQGQQFIAWFRALRSMTFSGGPNASIPNAIFAVLQGRVTTLDERAPSPEARAFLTWFRDFNQGLESEMRTLPLTDADIDVSDEFAGRLSTMSSSDYFVERCKGLARAKRNLFVSSEGYLGSGPENMTSEDQIVLIASVPVPMVLRKASDGSGRYMVLGAAFVHGLMEAKGWKKGWKEEEIQKIILI